MRLIAVAALLAGSGALANDACDALSASPAAMRAQDDGYALVFAPQPAPLTSGRHFALDIALCAGTTLPTSVRVDADMPAHRHGMNYRATVTAQGAGRYRAEGLMLHMPGRWRFVFDLALDGRTVRLMHEVDVP